MKVTSLILSGLALLRTVSAKAVFAHVVMGNTAAHTVAAWTNDITIAKNCGIDAFVLNMGYPDSNIPTQVSYAFQAANAVGGFKLFFAFDYLGGGSVWPATGSYSVVSVLNAYKANGAYYLYNGLPFVSTFEGGSNNADWAPGGTIRSAVGEVYFVPEYSGVGSAAISSYLSSMQGAFSWGMWPTGASNMTTAGDVAWKAAIGSRTYMMGVSPWFFHSAQPSYADWVWRGDDLWADRWAQTMTVNPDFVQIVSWNDWAESHYIGPIFSTNEIAAGSSVYVVNDPHESWRDFLPFYIARYKGSSFSITRDQMQYWYRQAPVAAGNTCGVTGNTATQGQVETTPAAILEDGIYFSALLMSAAEVRVQIGTNAYQAFQGVAGINHWSRPLNGQTGTPAFSVWRNGVQVAKNIYATAPILSATPLSNGCANYNPWVGSF